MQKSCQNVVKAGNIEIAGQRHVNAINIFVLYIVTQWVFPWTKSWYATNINVVVFWVPGRKGFAFCNWIIVQKHSQLFYSQLYQIFSKLNLYMYMESINKTWYHNIKQNINKVMSTSSCSEHPLRGISPMINISSYLLKKE